MVKKTYAFAIASVVVIALVAGVVLYEDSLVPSDTPATSSTPTGTIAVPPTPSADQPTAGNDLLEVIFLDVGQADSILLKTGDHAMLIDAGNTGQDKLMRDYLAAYGVTKLDYLVATHPHADHIGAMTAVVESMDSIGTVIMPDKPHTTATYKNLIKAIEKKNIPLTIPDLGEVFTLGSANIQVIAPKDVTTTDLNEVSIVLRVEFGETSFLFTGDADTKSENAQLAGGFTLKSDVIKVGHHGSRTASTKKYLDAVSPSYAVISCGADNTYGHPHSEAMTRLTATGAVIYRTDDNGTIIFVSDGKTITVQVTKGFSTPTTSPTETVYIGNKSSKTFHLDSCKSLPAEQNRAYFDSRQAALDAGYKPCGTCKP
jgi:competence protein ComEC